MFEYCYCFVDRWGLQLTVGILCIFLTPTALWLTTSRYLSFCFLLVFCMTPCHNYQHELLWRSKTWTKIPRDNAPQSWRFFEVFSLRCDLFALLGYGENKWAHQLISIHSQQIINHFTGHIYSSRKPNRLLNANSFISAAATTAKLRLRFSLISASLSLTIRFLHKNQPGSPFYIQLSQLQLKV